MARYIVEKDVNLTSMVSSQCSGAGIDMYTLWVCMVIGEDFKLSIRGQRNINNALTNLPVFMAHDDTLSFGWTLQHAIRNRGVHQSGYEHLALEIILSEAFQETYAANVLYDMAKMKAGEADTIPHPWQWRRLIRSSSGTFTSSDFGQLVEDYVRLFPYDAVLQGALKDANNVPSPKVMASTLRSLAQVTSEDDKQMMVVGGPVLAWFAAVAEWIFDLRIAIYSSIGERLYVNHETQATQVLLVYDQKSGISSHIGSWQDNTAKIMEAALAEQPESLNTYFVPIGGRVVWNSLLPRVFGRSFHHLDHEETKTFGTAIGAAARAFQELAEDPKHDEVVSSRNKANTASFGAGLVRTLTDWLPELRHVQGRMERQLKLPFEEAQKKYFQQIHHLQKVCGCSICAPTKDATAAPSKPAHDPDGYCLTVLVETTIALGLALSRMTVAAQTFPTRCGIQSLYKTQAAKRTDASEFDVSDIRHFKIIYGSEWNAPDARRLRNCSELFSGSRPTKDLPANLVALSHEGICAYMVKLERGEGSAHNGSNDGLIRVVSGAICVRHKIFTRACLGLPSDADEFDNFWEEMEFAHLSQPLCFR